MLFIFLLDDSGCTSPNENDSMPSVKTLINALSACLLSHVVSNDIKHWACKQLVSLPSCSHHNLPCYMPVAWQ